MAPEGHPILLTMLALALASSGGLLLTAHPALKVVVAVAWVLLIFTLTFFRDPVRVPPEDPQAFVSPADGKVVAIMPVGNDEHIQGDALRISIFLSLFNVHAQRVPIDAVVDASRYQRGRFLAAFNPGASLENEHAETYFTSEGGKFKVRQIAGVLARRILCNLKEGDSVKRGDRLGFIRFGSRVDILVPADFQLRVKVGDKVTGAITIIGNFSI